ncbi:MAG TPA: Uma2 family endonuclease [Planctomycetaceae bacterium]|nr:Uma2 family endonuclease [Planctomycetaceae bacterium]
MSTVVERPPRSSHRAAPVLPAVAGDYFLLTGMSWSFYEHLLAELGNRQIRVTYHRGALELMSPSYRHERGGGLLGWFVSIILEETGRPSVCGGSTTMRRQDVECGLEPDDCFWIENFSAVLGRREIDLTIDPAPDLSIEVDVASSSIDRLAVYAALRVPEVWRFDGLMIRVYRLNERGEYDVLDHSPTFPFLPLDKLIEFIERSVEIDDMTLRREFREWLRTEILPNLSELQ